MIDLNSITLEDKTHTFQSKIINVYQQNINKNVQTGQEKWLKNK